MVVAAPSGAGRGKDAETLPKGTRSVGMRLSRTYQARDVQAPTCGDLVVLACQAGTGYRRTLEHNESQTATPLASPVVTGIAVGPAAAMGQMRHDLYTFAKPPVLLAHWTRR